LSDEEFNLERWIASLPDDEKPKHQRVVDWLEMDKTFPTGLKSLLRNAVSPQHDYFLVGLVTDYIKAVEALNTRIKMLILAIVPKIEAVYGVTLTPTRSVCRQNCAVCLRLEGLHYPYWTIGKERVSKERFRDMCKGAGVSYEEYYELDRAVWMRHRLMAWMHGLPLVEVYTGMSKIKLTKKPKIKSVRKKDDVEEYS